MEANERTGADELDPIRAGAQSLMAAAAAAAPVLMTSPAGGGSVAAAAVGAAAVTLYTSVWPARITRVRRVLEQAGLDPDEPLDLNLRRSETAIQVLECAATADTEDHLLALARVLRETVEDEAGTRVDEHTLLVATLARLRAPHIRLLRAMQGPVVNSTGEPAGVDRKMVLARQPGLEPAIDALVEGCASLGLIFDTGYGTYGMSGWTDRAFRLTAWGELCLDYLGTLHDPRDA